MSRLVPGRVRGGRAAPVLLALLVLAGCTSEFALKVGPEAPEEAPAKIPTSSSYAGIIARTRARNCSADDKLDAAMATHSSVESFERLDPGPDLTESLVLVRSYAAACEREWESSLEDYALLVEPVDESFIDLLLKAPIDCRSLGSVDKLEAWPYKSRFVEEVTSRDFEAAEVTRRVWIDTLEAVEAGCRNGFSRRTAIEFQSRRERLQRIVGLDDPMLIDLRSQMLTAMEGGDAAGVAEYSRAIAQREASLDSANAAVYKAKLDEIERTMDAKLEAVAKAQRPAADKDPTSASTDVANAAQNVARTAEAAARTSEAIMSLF